ncbi:MAG: Nif3-like dinuclear metal center hexameric protein [Coraliomargaritaceae bacterium]
MVTLDSVISYCNERLGIDSIIDFENAHNGLQLENNGAITKIAASVDAGLIPLQQASQAKADLLLCHHGLFWSPIIPIKDHNYKKFKTAIDNNIAVYSAHLPLDCHPEIGNNALLAKALKLEVVDTFLEYKGTNYSFICQSNGCTRTTLSERLKALFPNTFSSILYGSETPRKIAILTGSGQSAVSYLKEHNIDTLITGELKQHHFNMAQELELNLYPCGHYATETFGVKALAEELANHFKIEWTFLDQDCLI